MLRTALVFWQSNAKVGDRSNSNCVFSVTLGLNRYKSKEQTEPYHYNLVII